MRVLVLGAYGLIGHEIARTLLAAGHSVTGLARSVATGRSLLPEAEWIGADLSELTQAERWDAHLRGIDAVINAAGALQSGGRDNVRLVQQDAMCALFEACERLGVIRFVQISAPDVSRHAETEFMRTKAVADEALQASGLKWVILRPGLVISHTAYGGTGLLRMLAAFPLVQPLVLGSARLQTVHVGDVAGAALRALDDERLNKGVYDLVEEEAHSLRAVIGAFRSWLGFAPARAVVELPKPVGFAVARLADLAGLLGWRSPLRSTALKMLDQDVTGAPEPWRKVTGERLRSLEETLSDLRSSSQERLYARLQLLWPLLVLILALFWIASGLIGMIGVDAAVGLISAGLGDMTARLLVYGGAVLDIFIGLGLLARATFKLACWASLGVCAAYLVSGSFLAPELWLDPLGPLVKIFPAMALAMVLVVLGEER